MGDGSWVMTVEDVSERKRAETLAAHLARYDALTGLPNRAQFIEALSLAIDQVRESGRRIALASFDLDHLGEVNDAHGVEAGDAVLAGIAARARADGRVGELVARVGGDEFCVLKTMEAEEELEEFVPRLLRTITTPIMVGGKRVSASARMGIAIYPNDASDGSRLMANAELALARAREEAAGAVRMYDPDYDEVARHRRELVRDMIEGLQRGEFHVAYQQQSSILDGEVIGHEALLRWRHPIRGAIGPDEFIPVAEQSGFIGQLGLWVLDTACREAMEVDLPGRLAVNLSPFQLDDVDLADNIARILRTTGFSPSRLELEVTETAVVSNKARALRTLGALQDLGIGIALDDFGTGYSSIETLRALRWDKLKLDRSLLTEVEDCTQGRAIMRAVISLGQALGTTVLAEGVETEVQLRLLQEEGCDQVQGYLFGRPAPIQQVRPTADADLEELRGMVR
jgi:diguanylate cyclase (GGDEF)-like protein